MICAVEGCERPRSRRQWCGAHYKRWWKYGDPAAGAELRLRGTVIERFWAKVLKSDGCWEWQGACNNNGYGLLMIKEPGEKKIARTTHRLSWELNVGPIPEGMWVLHRCDNPPCVRPDHLFLGTTNIKDMWDKGRRDRDSVFPRNPQTELA